MASAQTNSGPFIGSRISLISVAEMRYEGILFAINTEESTVALNNVKSFGTEGRKAVKGEPEVAPSPQVYEFIIFRGKDIEDLTVCEAAKPFDDPAIVSVNVPPEARQQNRYSPRPQQHQHHQPHPHPHQQHYAAARPQMAHRSNYASFGGQRPVSRPRGRGGRGRGGNRMLGQLMPQPTNLKTELAANFDFTEGGTIDRDSIQVEIERKEKGEITNMNVPDVRGGYDGTTSFFDDISCDALERQRRNEVRFDRETLRELDTETFGQATANRHRMDYMRYRRGGFNRGCRKLFMQSLGINSR